MTFLAICDKADVGDYLAKKPKFPDHKGVCEYIIVATKFDPSRAKPFQLLEIHSFTFQSGVMREHATFDNSRQGFHRRGRATLMTDDEKKRLIGVINFVIDNFHRSNGRMYFVSSQREVYLPFVNKLPLNNLHNPTWKFVDVDLRREMLLTL